MAVFQLDGLLLEEVSLRCLAKKLSEFSSDHSLLDCLPEIIVRVRLTCFDCCAISRYSVFPTLRVSLFVMLENYFRLLVNLTSVLSWRLWRDKLDVNVTMCAVVPALKGKRLPSCAVYVIERALWVFWVVFNCTKNAF